ncbi:MAG: PEP-CTERM sorting domain-containing protein [Desulfuromonadaceae bacterium]|nr:PEP-CTERM sorting domain-containing protein [Desulfuromonadaceae bacterium]
MENLNLSWLRSIAVACAVMLLMTISVTPAHATLIDNGTYVTDTTTNLKWLKLSATAGTSYSDLQPLLQTTFTGWSLATASQVYSLWNDAGLYNAADTNKIQTANTFISIMGNTADAMSGATGNSGYYYDADAISNYEIPVAKIYIMEQVISIYSPGSGGTQYLYETAPSEYFLSSGAYLVESASTPVPEPGTVALFAFGIAGLAVYGKKRKGNNA